MEEFILAFAVLIVSVMIISFIIKLFNQPIILGYVLAGLAYAYMSPHPEFNDIFFIFSEIGITFLLFLMGVEFDLKGIKYLGKDIFTATFIQCIIFFGISFGIALLLGFSMMQAVYLGMLFMFTSTLLVAKWLVDKKENNSLHGKIVIGMLIIEDIIAILALTVLSILKESSFIKIALIPLEGFLLVAIAVVFAKYLLNKPLKFSSKYPELLFLVSLSVCFIFVWLAPHLGYSTTIGGFIGGVVLANTLYRADIITRLKPLITFFNMLFFIGLGFQMSFALDVKMFIFLALVLILSITLRPIIVFLNLRMHGYDLKTSFVSSIYMSPLSEFGIIIFASGVGSGSIDLSLNSIAVLAVIVSMIISSYFIKYDKKIFHWLQPQLLQIDKKFITKNIKQESIDVKCNVIFFGYCDVNKSIFQKLKDMGKTVAVIENDPENIALLKKEGIDFIFSSINNPDFFENINFEKLELVISSLTDKDENTLLIEEIKKTNPKATIIVTAKSLKESLYLYNHHADYVLYSSYLNEQRVSVLLDDYTSNINNLLEKKIVDLAKLKEKSQRIQDSREDEFMDIDSFIKRAKATSGKNSSKRQEVKEEVGKDKNKDKSKVIVTRGSKYESDNVKKPDNMIL